MGRDGSPTPRWLASGCAPRAEAFGANPTWIIAGDTNERGKIIRGRSKNAKAQRVPLSKQAAALFREAVKGARQCSDSAKADCVFPADLGKVAKGTSTVMPHIRGDSVSRAVLRFRKRAGLSDLTTHDLRRAIATWCGDNGVRPDVIDAILSHKPKDVTRLHYNLSTLDPLVRNALQGWADHLDRLVADEGDEGAGNVVQITRAVAG